MHRTVGGNVDVWLLEIARGVRTRLTSHPANDIHPQWSADGSTLLFSSNRTGSYQLMQLHVPDRQEKVVLTFQAPATDWSKDGVVLIQRRDVTATSDIWAFRIGTGQEPFPVVQTPEFEERDAQFSPDAKWIAYASSESGRWEVYVQAFPGPGPKVAVSVNGGAQPRWRPDGKELFFIAPDDRLMAASVSIAPDVTVPRVGVPVPLFGTSIGGAVQGSSRQQYFVARDGQRFLVNTILDRAATSPITLVVNWHPNPNRLGR
jgi:Tol biopolymer transport system component